MSVEEIFAKVIQHMIKGMMIHEQFANYFDFLGLSGYKRWHEYQYFDESIEYRSVVRYYISHNNKLIGDSRFENPNIIPESWYKYNRQDVDISTKKTSVKTAFQTWESWEQDTKDLYEECYKQLLDLEEVASAQILLNLVNCVNNELKCVQRENLHLKALDFDMSAICNAQRSLHKKYKKKLHKIGESIC